MNSTRFKKIILNINGTEIDLDEYTELEDRAESLGMQVDPETLKIVPIQEQTKQWPEGDRQPEDYEGGK